MRSAPPAPVAQVEIAVTDTGVGLAPEFIPFAFERFRQGDQSFTRTHGGLGLGLAIVKHLVEMHGGDVSAESAGIGRGATFRIRLPIQDVVVTADAVGPEPGIDGAALPSIDDPGVGGRHTGSPRVANPPQRGANR